MLASRAAVALGPDGAITALAASTEMGQGAITTFAQIVADAVGVPPDWVDVATPDTADVPNSGPTVASRTVMIVGGLLERAAARLRQRIVSHAGTFSRTRAALATVARQLHDEAGGDARALRFEEEYQKPPEVVWDEQLYRGDAYPVYSYAAAAVDLEVDRQTFEVSVRKVTTAQDIGKAINPLLVEGQIIGGTAQGLGYALLEHAVYKQGVMQNAQLTNYIIPTSLDMPPLDVVLVEKPYSRGPSGAKGIGELPMDVPGPAVAAAIFRATGLFIPELPILPERILAAHLAARGANH
jgi:CO/xanthine dehydrogenase Mo-binding subunit